MNHQFRGGLTAMLLIFTASTLAAKAVLAQTALEGPSFGAHSPIARADEAVKVGEQQPLPGSFAKGNQAVASIYTHTVSGKSAATLYVRGIPVLTFLAPATESFGPSKELSSSDIKLGQVAASTASPAFASAPTQSSLPRVLADAATRGLVPQSFQPAPQAATPADRAAALAAKLNQFSRDGIDAASITVNWKEVKGGTGLYSIQTTSGELVSLGTSNTIFPETTQNPEQDALLATNRLRRLMGNAAPLSQVQGKPKAVAATDADAADPSQVRQTIKGWASWYGPGFDGNLSASGEVFRQSAMTAAHKSLPFGTRVRVTNLDTGRSVIVRINDRGPYVGDRIIDLSAGAARVIGLEASGVAPIRLEILEKNSTIAGR
jgi:rare lipoprotein A